ncbi:hypothetical protein AHAS_Ahas11G0133800 [Arachis hypogaea]
MADVVMLMVREFYANAWVTYKHAQGVNLDPKKWCTMVRGAIMEFSLERVRKILHLPPSRDKPYSYTQRVNMDQRLDQVLADIRLSKAQWRRDSRGQPYQLGKHDLRPVARGWLEFIQCSIIPTSNRSEVTIDRAVMIHCIMLGNEVEVHWMIPQEIYRLADKAPTSTRLTFFHLIRHICEDAQVHIDGDTPLLLTNLSLGGGMEHARELGHLWIEHQDHSTLLYQLVKEQLRQMCDLDELKCQRRFSGGSSSHHN